MIRVILPAHLRTLARVEGDVPMEFAGEVSLGMVLDELEKRYPMLQGAIRDHVTGQRRPFLRFFVCQEDWSHEPHDKPLPDEVVSGREPLFVIGAIAGGNERPRADS